MAQDATLGVLNTPELLDAEYDLRDATGDPDGLSPAGYPRPIAALPDWPLAPDAPGWNSPIRRAGKAACESSASAPLPASPSRA